MKFIIREVDAVWDEIILSVQPEGVDRIYYMTLSDEDRLKDTLLGLDCLDGVKRDEEFFNKILKLNKYIDSNWLRVYSDSDEWDCDTCGWHMAGGWEVEVLDEKYSELKAFASCFGGGDYGIKDLFLYILDVFDIPYTTDIQCPYVWHNTPTEWESEISYGLSD